MVRSKFDEQLKELNNEMIQMGAMIEEAIAEAVNALAERDIELAEKIIAQDSDIDHAKKHIEDICFQLLIQQQPVARDLRVITAALKMVTDMERIGDHAADISELTVFLKESKRTVGLAHINKMASETMLMLHWSIEAYVEKSEEQAKKVIAYDDVVDELFSNVRRDVIDLIVNDSQTIEEATDWLMIGKYFERIGDHATNIAEWVIYSLRTTPIEEEN